MTHFHRSMNIRLALSLLACSILLQPELVLAWRVEYDGGPIEAISEGKLYVQGNTGQYIFEPIGLCSWCEVGIEVLISLQSLTRATLRPKSESFSARPVNAFIIRDARE
jgi:hypothetical protein